MDQKNTGSNYIIQLVGGLYLSYQGFMLAKGYFAGETSNIIFLIAGGIFLFIGVFLLIYVARIYLSGQKEGGDDLENIEEVSAENDVEDEKTEVIEAETDSSGE